MPVTWVLALLPVTLPAFLPDILAPPRFKGAVFIGLDLKDLQSHRLPKICVEGLLRNDLVHADHSKSKVQVSHFVEHSFVEAGRAPGESIQFLHDQD